MDITTEKSCQRKIALAARKALSKESRMQKSLAISERILDNQDFSVAKTIFSYQPFAGEVDITSLNEKAVLMGKRVAYPICDGKGGMIAALPLNNTWCRDSYGILEPIIEQSTIIQPEEFDLILVPCIAFDSRRMRIGWGAGYYDRYLPRCVNAVYIAVAFEVQQVEMVASDPSWDVALDAVITEERQY